ncbi:hypothetical protein E1H12_15305 [Geitlerinema sp. P-1104]|jgi:hypothetical protein|uniref:hypothetical protein n=1 Tax=Cyanophyceae TaxID=3028117 RepID=UPI00122BBD85|nr:hypothetical protein [Geitlerinema sp. P-1104]NMG59846.1 hypothetical protein [Geitlerinema sp. P-1104]TAN86961.1 MAG: hypothetical protein EYR95_16830 [Phormidium sp. SL48-SHIP]
MSVIYIGDRETGKTSLAMELANPNSQFVKVLSPDYDQLKALLYDDQEGRTRPTESDQSTHDRSLEIEVVVPTRRKTIYTEWIDTPGEIWRASWQQTNSDQWNQFVKVAQGCQGVLLVVPPYREIVRHEEGINLDDFVTQTQWVRRFDRWVEFFKHDCSHIKHIALCLNKADLLQGVNLKREAQTLAYKPQGSRMNWMQRNDYVFKRFFRPVRSHIAQLNQRASGVSVKCFITSIYNRDLLELPWIYLGTFLKEDT